ncbi:MAG: ribosome maturation factor RimM [Sphaerochaetaceae bacterium]
MDYLATGVLKGPHGVKGLLKFQLFSSDASHLKTLTTIELRKGDVKREMEIQFIQDLGHASVIKFTGIDTPEQARTYSGWELWIRREEALSLEEGEYYVADLLGCAMLVAGKKVATVISWIDGAQSVLLEVESLEHGKRFLIPFLAQYIGHIDLSEKTIELLMAELLQ